MSIKLLSIVRSFLKSGNVAVQKGDHVNVEVAKRIKGRPKITWVRVIGEDGY